MNKCLVTGGAGFIGSHIVEELCGKGASVRVLDNFSTGRRENLAAFGDRVELIEGDVADEQTVVKAVNGIDCVFHQAALASVPASLENPLATHRACVTGALNVLHQSVRAGVKRVVYAASSSCYGERPEPVKSESLAPMVISPYGAAKLAAEFYAQSFYHSFGLETVCLRYFNVFGPRQDPNSPYSAVIPIFISRMLNGESPVVHGDGLQSRDFVFVKDVVQANLKAATAKDVGGQSFNVGCGKSITLLDLIEHLNELLGTSIPPHHGEARPGDVRDSLADIGKITSQLGFQPSFSFESGLRQSIDYYRQL